MATAPLTFSQRTAIGSNDDNLRKAMAAARTGLFHKASIAMSHPDFQTWREQGARIRDAALAKIDVLLEEFEEQATAAGAQVHWAADAATARNLVATLTAQHGAQKIIKSKSMLTEEIGLNDGLAAKNLDVLETDLGEYIVQLSKGRPSHIIAPIIHMTAEQVKEVFVANHADHPRTTREEMVAEARAVLRPRMLAADLGITGANFLVADTGSVVLVTNEGNGRYCTTLPPVRITIAGIEKIVPTAKELAVLLRLLPRAATGQESSAYVSIATGSRGASNPKHHHIILIDNGRSRLLGGKYRKMLRCIRCGSCMNHCPVYRVAGGLSYGSVYAGPMGAILSPNLFGHRYDDLPHAATMCGACSMNCPVKIPLPDLMRNLREDQIDSGDQALLEKILFGVWAFAACHPTWYGLGTRIVSWLMRTCIGSGKSLHSLPGGKGWFEGRDLRMPEHRPFRHSDTIRN